MFNAHNYGMMIETLGRRVFGFSDRGGFGGIIDADVADSDPYFCMSCILANVYGTSSSDKKIEIEEFLETYAESCLDKSIIDIGEEKIKEFILSAKQIIG